MRTRMLGTSAEPLSVLGLGAWAFGGAGWFAAIGAQDDAMSIATIHHALGEGMSWVDAAPIYGLGHAERIVGRAIADRRDAVFLATKCTNRWTPAGEIFQTGAAHSVREECEQSLRRLGVDYVDLLQIHALPRDVPIEETWGTLARLVEEGKCRYIGVSSFDVATLERCRLVRPVDAMQLEYGLLARDAEREVLSYCASQGVSVLAYGALGHGLLSERWHEGRWGEDDFRRTEHATFVARARDVVTRLSPLAAARGQSVAELALAWVLEHPAVTAVVVGARTPGQVVELARAGRGAPDPGIRHLLDDALRAR